MRKTSSTTNSESLGSFGLRCGLFFAPLVGGFLFMLGQLYPTGDLLTPDQAVARQRESGALYLPDFHRWPQFFARYHLAGVIQRHPEIVIFGSSRVKTMRSDLFRTPASQFNAGLPGTDLATGNWRRFLEKVPPGGLPRYVFIGIDPWWYRTLATVEPSPDFTDAYSSLELVDFAWRRGFWWSIDQLKHPSAPAPGYLGVQAMRERLGLRPDGSLSSLRGEGDENAEEVERRLQQGKRPFLHDSPTLSRRATEEFERFLLYCQERHIHVIGYLSPFKPTHYAAMRREHGIDYFWNVAPALTPLFEHTQNELFDLTDPALPGCADAEFLDGVHESEVCSARVLLAMARRSQVVESLIDVSRLEDLLAHRKSERELGL
jgi:hypothetical protein